MRNPVYPLLACALLSTLAAAQLELHEVTADSGLAAKGGDRFAFADYDDDGDPDLLVNAARLYRNDSVPGHPMFREVTKGSGLAGARGPGACWFDFDHDGRLDFATTAGQVWIQDKRRNFREIGAALGLAFPAGTTASMAWGDLDGDGWLDLFTGGGEDGKTFKCERQTLWLNGKRKTLEKLKTPKQLAKIRKLEEVAEKHGVPPLPRYGRAIVWCDYDWDGDDDIYSGNYRLQPNALFRNEFGELKDVAAELGVTGRRDPDMFTVPWTGKRAGYIYGHTIGAAWGDLDGDGYFDLWVSNLVHKYAGKVDAEFAKVLGSEYDTRGFICDDSNLFINSGPPEYRFEDRRAALGIPIKPVGGRGKYRGDELWSNVVLGDLDLDGWLDSYVNQVYGHLPYSHCLLFLGSASGFRESHASAGVKLWGGYGAALADLDSDGRLDLVAGGSAEVGGKKLLHVYHNRGPEAPWIGFDIPCYKGYVRVGAKLLLVQEKGVQLRQLQTTMGAHTQQGDPRFHFGLGSGGEVLDAVVYWPDGVVQSLGPVKPGKYHRIRKRRGSGPRLGRLTPTSARAGEEVAFKIGARAPGAKFHWDFGGSRHPEVITGDPAARHTFPAPGKYTIWIRAGKPGGLCDERSYVVRVE